MSFTKNETVSAEQRFRQAFMRLKENKPIALLPGSAVTQNNVAREAGCDPSALRKSRFPALIREIRAYVELHNDESASKGSAHRNRKNARRSEKERLADALRQRDAAQSLVASANRRIVELNEKVNMLQQRLDELQPPPLQLS
jgi:hypothetical protein